MAFSQFQSNQATTGTTVSAAFGSNVAVGDLVVAYAPSESNGINVTFSNSGTATVGSWTEIAGLNQSDAGDGYEQEVAYARVTGAGTLTVTATWGSGQPWMALAAMTFNEMPDPLELQDSQYDAVTATNPDGTDMTPASQPAWVVGFGLRWGSPLQTPGADTAAGFTSAGSGCTYGGTAIVRAEYQRITATTALDMEFTTTNSGKFYLNGLIFTEAAAGGDITAAGSLSITGVADLDATGSLTAAGSLSVTGAADLDASGALLAAGALSITGAADLDAIGQLTAVGSLAIDGAADLDAIGQLAAAGSLAISGVADLTGSLNDIVASGALSISGVADLDATGTLVAAGSLSITGAADLTGVAAGDISAAGTLSITGIADLDAIGNLGVLGSLSIIGSADLTSAAVVAQEVFTGGFWYAYDLARDRYKKRLKELDELEEQAKEIADETDREIAQFLHADQRQEVEAEERKRLQELARNYSDSQASNLLGERVAKAMARASVQGNFSAVEAFMREVERAREEEEFLLKATMLLIELN